MENYSSAAVRHWKDAELLESENRVENADHHYGFAAECAIKKVLVAFLSVISQFDGLTFTIGDGQSGQDERRPGQQNGTGIATGAVLASGG